jgi:glycosyltransferase 2 family protein
VSVPLETSAGEMNVSAQNRPSLVRRHGIKALVSIVIAVAFAWVLLRAGLPIVPNSAAMARVRWPLVAAHAAILFCVHFVRAIRWRHLLRPIAPDIRRRRVMAASWIGFTAILMLPLRAGEFVRPWLIRDRKQITFSAALGTLGAERVIDGFVVTLVLAGALIFVPRLDPLPQTFGDLKIPVAAIPAAGYIALAVFTAAFIAMALFYFARSFSQRLVKATIGRISPKLGDKLAGIVSGLADGLHFLANPRHGIPFIGETLFYWGLNATGMWVLGLGCGLDMTFGHACAVMGVLAIGILVPAGPGLFGAFQASTYGALAMFFAPSTVVREGAAYVFLLYVVQFVWHIVAAGIGVVFDPAVLKPDPESADEAAT